MPQDATPAPRAGRPLSRAALDFGLDRVAAFRQARRHTAFVRSLRMLLPVSAVLMFAVYGFFMQRSISINVGSKKIQVDSVSISREALVAHNPRYEGFDKQGGKFEVRAATAQQDHKQKGIVLLKSIDGKLVDTANQTTTLKSPRGVLDTNTNVLEMYERIDVVAQNGMSADLTRATVYTKENRIVSNEPVTVRMPSGTVRGQAMTIEQKKKVVLFTGGVIAKLQPQPKAGQAQLPVDPALRGSQTQGSLAKSNAPIDVTSQRLLVDDTAKLATFAGNVVARQADQTLETAELEITYEGQPQPQPQPQGQQPAVAAADGSGRLRRLVSRSDVVLSRGLERATGSSGDFDAVNDRAVLTGPVVISAGPDRGATADRAEIDNKNDTILLTGNVVVTQQKNVLRGRRLLADRKQGTVQLSAPAAPGQPKAQINAKLYQQEGSGAAAKKAAAPSPTAAAGPLGSVRSDPSQPIDIDADTLDVDDKKKTAIFRGKVKAIQGDYVINTEELHAHYTGDGGMALGMPTGTPAASAKAPPGQPKTGAELKQVIAPRKVDIVAKDGQRATGNAAVFDPKANTALLSGDVVLTQGTTITQGSCARLEMDTGLMRILDACGFAASGPATPAAGTAAAAAPATKPGRAQLLLYPGLMKEEQKAKDEQKKAAKAAETVAPAPAQPAAAAAPSPSPSPSPAPRRPARTEDTPSSVFGSN